jgi:sialate O-acetylesterase
MATVFETWADVRLPIIFSDNMVLQQGKPVKIWGTAAPQESVIVQFQQQTHRTTADINGNWSITLTPLTATKTQQQLSVEGEKNSIVLRNILIGEVWLASGQSNMEYSMNNHQQYSKPKRGDANYQSKAFRKANSPLIRTLHVKRRLDADTLPSLGWTTLSQKTLAPVSAVAYFFAKTLTDNLDVPVGIISTSWGGTEIETWMTAGARFQKMVRPMIPFAIKGFLWYQGEANLIKGDEEQYCYKQQTLVESWREAWQDTTLSFYYVQLAPYTYSQRRGDPVSHTWEALPRFWEVQYACMQHIPRSGMAQTTDLVDDVTDIHPPYKWIVGERLARWALAKDYGKNQLVCMGPALKNYRIAGDKIIVDFDNADSGLTTNDGQAPNRFEISDKSGMFRKADASIEGKTVVLSNANIKEPYFVRYAWDEVAVPNLFNRDGLPALPFTTYSATPLYHHQDQRIE